MKLKGMEKIGVISDLVLQPAFILQEAYIHKSEGKIHAIKYVADFSYWKDGVKVVEDVKGIWTEVYKIKRKIFLFKYPDINFIET